MVVNIFLFREIVWEFVWLLLDGFEDINDLEYCRVFFVINLSKC